MAENQTTFPAPLPQMTADEQRRHDATEIKGQFPQTVKYADERSKYDEKGRLIDGDLKAVRQNSRKAILTPRSEASDEVKAIQDELRTDQIQISDELPVEAENDPNAPTIDGHDGQIKTAAEADENAPPNSDEIQAQKAAELDAPKTVEIVNGEGEKAVVEISSEAQTADENTDFTTAQANENVELPKANGDEIALSETAMKPVAEEPMFKAPEEAFTQTNFEEEIPEEKTARKPRK